MGIIRVCTKCNVGKPLSEFNKNKQGYKYGVFSVCRLCVARKHREGHSPERQAARRIYWKKYKDGHGPAIADKQRLRKKLPEERLKNDARAFSRLAVKFGLITKGVCERCGSGQVDAHHEDYWRPLFVRWFCRFHHAQEHERSLLDKAV
jgi:hypothetical protein